MAVADPQPQNRATFDAVTDRPEFGDVRVGLRECPHLVRETLAGVITCNAFSGGKGLEVFRHLHDGADLVSHLR